MRAPPTRVRGGSHDSKAHGVGRRIDGGVSRATAYDQDTPTLTGREVDISHRLVCSEDERGLMAAPWRAAPFAARAAHLSVGLGPVSTRPDLSDTRLTVAHSEYLALRELPAPSSPRAARRPRRPSRPWQSPSARHTRVRDRVEPGGDAGRAARSRRRYRPGGRAAAAARHRPPAACHRRRIPTRQ
jgi:hypothetical protein